MEKKNLNELVVVYKKKNQILVTSKNKKVKDLQMYIIPYNETTSKIKIEFILLK